VARDPDFAVAYCLLSTVHLELYFGGADHTPARRELAHAAIEAAARLQPDAGEVHLGLARYAYNVFRDYDRARAELDLARRTLPNSSEIYLLNGALDRRQARWAESVRNWERAVELDPRNVYVLENAAFTYKGLKRYDEARQLFARSIAVAPRNYNARTWLALMSVFERADNKPLRDEISAILNEDPQAAGKILEVMFLSALWDRDRTQATARWQRFLRKASRPKQTLPIRASGLSVSRLAPLTTRKLPEPHLPPPAPSQKSWCMINPNTLPRGPCSGTSMRL
jgi:tetratricopeptide (TPR) repeat protein